MPPHHGGIERVAEDHAKAAHEAGMEVRWISSREPRETPEVEKTDWGTALRVKCWNGFEASLGVPYPVWLGSARKVIRESVEWCDVIHAHDLLYQGTSMALTEAKRLGKPVLITQHVGFVPMKRAFLGPVQRMAYKTVGRRNARRATGLAYYNDAALAWVRESCGFEREAAF